MRINLFTTLGCHLCEDALALLNEFSAEKVTLDIIEVEISHSARLLEQYGERIPVVKVLHANDELGWPFDSGQLETYIQAQH